MKITIKDKTITIPVTSKLHAGIKAVLIEAAAPKLTKNSPPAAKFHRMMREYHKGECKTCDAEMKPMHKQCAMEHDAKYKKAMGVKK
jgi:hypothetical protein